MSLSQIGATLDKSHVSFMRWFLGVSYEASMCRTLITTSLKTEDSVLNKELNKSDLFEKITEEIILDEEGFIKARVVKEIEGIFFYWLYWRNKKNNKAFQFLNVIPSNLKDLGIEEEKAIEILNNISNNHSPKTKVKKIKKCYVYLIQAGNTNFVKIGVSFEPQRRLRDLQTSHYEELKIVAFKEGGKDDELRLHIKFKDSHVRGEWFKFSDDIKLEFDLPLKLDRYLEIKKR
jgi:hypothetical protein